MRVTQTPAVSAYAVSLPNGSCKATTQVNAEHHPASLSSSTGYDAARILLYNLCCVHMITPLHAPGIKPWRFILPYCNSESK